MLDPEQFSKVVRILPFLQQSHSRLATDFQRVAYYARIPTGRDIFVEGDDVSAIALVVSGAVRVYKVSDTGREITMYRFGSGESCILTANAILNKESFSAIATVEDEVEAIMIPADIFRDWVNQHDEWRSFVFSLLSQRLSRVMEIVEEVTFGRMDSRIATLLLERSTSENPISITHQDIADELGSSREVISRLLGNLANDQIIRLHRGMIEILDHELLKSLSVR